MWVLGSVEGDCGQAAEARGTSAHTQPALSPSSCTCFTALLISAFSTSVSSAVTAAPTGTTVDRGSRASGEGRSNHPPMPVRGALPLLQLPSAAQHPHL